MTIESPYATLLAAIPVERHETQILGSTTRFWAYGADDAETTVVIAHGYRGEHHGIEPIIAPLPTIRFVSPDLPGFGESTPMADTPHSVDGYAA
ncbi:MAG: putative hydrolase or acyltransferase, partial [Naasia sp.]|nr:putative hydrolase or acyltransferase [Naasia sp.]